MHRPIISTLAATIVFCVLIPGCGKEPQPQPEQEEQPEQTEPSIVICDAQFHITTPDQNRQLGQLALKAVSNDYGKQIEIVEEVTMEYRRKQARYKSTVVYATQPALVPLRAGVEIKIDANVSMTGEVTFDGKVMSYAGKGFMDKRTGEKKVEPREFGENDVGLGEGALLFQSAFAVVGPRLLEEVGELDNVVFIEFPDDIAAPELINTKAGYRLTRDKADDQGVYRMDIFAPNTTEPVYSALFDKNDVVISMPVFGRAKLIQPKGE